MRDHAEWLASLKPGDTVWWNDPEGFSNGTCKVAIVPETITDDAVIDVVFSSEGAAEVLPHELTLDRESLLTLPALEDWQHEVVSGDTKLGFAEWSEHQIESAGYPWPLPAIGNDCTLELRWRVRIDGAETLEHLREHAARLDEITRNAEAAGQVTDDLHGGVESASTSLHRIVDGTAIEIQLGEST